MDACRGTAAEQPDQVVDHPAVLDHCPRLGDRLPPVDQQQRLRIAGAAPPERDPPARCCRSSLVQPPQQAPAAFGVTGRDQGADEWEVVEPGQPAPAVHDVHMHRACDPARRDREGAQQARPPRPWRADRGEVGAAVHSPGQRLLLLPRRPVGQRVDQVDARRRGSWPGRRAAHGRAGAAATAAAGAAFRAWRPPAGRR